MPVVAVVNRKGGVGKSTLATHLAGWCAKNGLPVMLGDVDRNQSAQTWLRLRQARGLNESTRFFGGAVDPRNVLRTPPGVDHVVLDTPGGLRGFDLARVVCHADAVIVPVCQSMFDRESAADCYAELLAMPRVASGRCKVAAVGMRLDARTKAAEVLQVWAAQQGLPFVGVLRESQAYVRCVEMGLTLFDLAPARVAADLAQWVSIIDWLRPMLYPNRPVATGLRPSYKPNVGRPAQAPVAALAGAPLPTHVLPPGRLPPLAARPSLAAPTWSAPAPPVGWIDRVGELISPARR